MLRAAHSAPSAFIAELKLSAELSDSFSFGFSFTMKKSTHLTIWELVLLLASILVFRSGWLLLDQFEWFSSITGLVILLGIGLLVCFIALKLINRD